MKEGKVWDEVHAFLLLYLRQLYRPFFLTLFFTHSGAGSPVPLKVWLKSFALLEVSVRDSGSNRRKKLIRLSPPIPFVPPPLKSFVLFCYTDYILSMNKSCSKTTTLHGYKISRLMFISFVYQTINRKGCISCCELWELWVGTRRTTSFSYRI